MINFFAISIALASYFSRSDIFHCHQYLIFIKMWIVDLYSHFHWLFQQVHVLIFGESMQENLQKKLTTITSQIDR